MGRPEAVTGHDYRPRTTSATQGHTIRHRLLTSSAALLLLVGCGDDTSTTDDAPADTEEPEGGSAPEADAEDEGSDGEDFGDRPEAYASLLTEGTEPTLDVTEGEVSIAAIGEPARGSIPLIVHNGTDQPVSRVEVSGQLVDGGDVITSGNSQGLETNFIPPGEYAIGFVYAGPDDLPAGAQLDSPAVDYTEGLGDFDDIVALDVEEVDVNTDRATGTLSNPHDVAASGPVSVALACIGDGGDLLGVWSTFADRDDVGPGDSSTFTIDFFGDGQECAGVVVGASAYNAEAM